MGVDIVAIMKHELTLDEVISLPDVINTWTDIHQFHKDFNDDKKDVIDAKWDAGNIEVTKDIIEKEWIAWENNQVTQSSLRITTSFADFKLNRFTLNTCPMWRHKWSNLYDFETREFVISLNRKIAEKLGVSRIIYCVDSACSTYILKELSLMGWKFEDIEKYGINEFGVIPTRLTEAVYNYFFIDDLSIDLNDYNEEKYIFNRCNEEYFLEKKFGQQFVIKRK
jgi:hypothetical protein